MGAHYLYLRFLLYVNRMLGFHFRHLGYDLTWVGWRWHHLFNPRFGFQSLHLLSLIALSALLLLLWTGILQAEHIQYEHMHSAYTPSQIPVSARSISKEFYHTDIQDK